MTHIAEVTDAATLALGAELFDGPLIPESVQAFLGLTGHHLLFAWNGDDVVGLISGTMIWHPDKAPEMYLNELGVAERARGRGVGVALVRALHQLARGHGAVTTWGVSEPDNVAARATYRRAEADEQTAVVLYGWSG